jgi:hypothetical protein
VTKAAVVVAMGYFSYSYFTDFEQASFISEFYTVSIKVQPAKRYYLMPKEIEHLFYFQAASANSWYTSLPVENDSIKLSGIIPDALVLAEETDSGLRYYSMTYDKGLRSYRTHPTSLSFSRREYQFYHCFKALGLFLLFVVPFVLTDMLTIMAYKIPFIISITLSIAIFGYIVFGFLYGGFFRTFFL